jgi:nitric oxide reductase NorE protein
MSAAVSNMRLPAEADPDKTDTVSCQVHGVEGRMRTDAVVMRVQSNDKVPGEEGIWLLISGDLLVFSLFFIIFLYYRDQNIELFSASRAHLSRVFGTLNTVLMLTSSWFVALAVHAARKQLVKATSLCFALALLCGVGFSIVKVLEYGDKIHAGIGLNTNDFFMYYFVFTGIHLLHVLLGMGVLTVLALYSRSGEFSAVKIKHLETGASFWHLVDLLWIVLFALLYLI